MKNNQKGIKNYWNILKEEFRKNKRVFFLSLLLFVIFSLVLLWTVPASSSATERLMMVAPLAVSLIIFILAIPIGLVNRRKYENAIVGKNPWEIAEVKFRQYAKGLFIMFVVMALFNAWFIPLFAFGTEFLAVAFVYAVAFMLFLIIASLFKRKSPKAIAVGYNCLIPLLIFAVYLCLYLFFSTLFKRTGVDYGYWIYFLFLSSFLIQGIMDIYKASKYTADIKRDSELQKEII